VCTSERVRVLVRVVVAVLVVMAASSARASAGRMAKMALVNRMVMVVLVRCVSESEKGKIWRLAASCCVSIAG
jgi:1-aminocyclopropane-1-carboxylate deaminase/D-cysteine desulfhydrase-like pyridoxal-dependent ACC family enzyme